MIGQAGSQERRPPLGEGREGNGCSVETGGLACLGVYFLLIWGRFSPTCSEKMQLRTGGEGERRKSVSFFLDIWDIS